MNFVSFFFVDSEFSFLILNYTDAIINSFIWILIFVDTKFSWFEYVYWSVFYFIIVFLFYVTLPFYVEINTLLIAWYCVIEVCYFIIIIKILNIVLLKIYIIIFLMDSFLILFPFSFFFFLNLLNSFGINLLILFVRRSFSISFDIEKLHLNRHKRE